jgi:hypothetical protein
VADAQGLPLSRAVVEAVGDTDGAGEGLREGAGEPEGPPDTEVLEEGEGGVLRDAVGNGERVEVPVTVAEVQPEREAPPVAEDAGLTEGVRDAVFDADAEREGDSEPEAQGVAEGHTVELAVGHTVKQPDVEGVALVVGQPVGVPPAAGEAVAPTVVLPEASTLSVGDAVGAAEPEGVPEMEGVSEKESEASALFVAIAPRERVAPP